MCVFYLPQLPHNLLAVLLLAHARFLKNNFCLLDAMLPFYLYFPHHYYTFDTVDSLTPTSIVPPTLTHSHTHTQHTHTILMSSFLVLMMEHQLVLIQPHLLTLTFPIYTSPLVSTLLAMELKLVSLPIEDSEEWEG